MISPCLITFSDLLLFFSGPLKNEDYSSSLVNITRTIFAFSLNHNVIYCTDEWCIQISCFSSQGSEPGVSLTWILSDISKDFPSGFLFSLIFISFLPFHFMLFNFLCSLTSLPGSIIIFLIHIYKPLSFYLIYIKWLLSIEKKSIFWIQQERGCEFYIYQCFKVQFSRVWALESENFDS